jgi:hypothetical protein
MVFSGISCIAVGMCLPPLAVISLIGQQRYCSRMTGSSLSRQVGVAAGIFAQSWKTTQNPSH